jgi:thioredoxin-like negative regulator of GroEL
MKPLAIFFIAVILCPLLWGADEQPRQPPRLTFMEFGSDMCVSCRGMRAVTEEIAKKYDGVVTVVFSDVMISDSLATVYKVEQIPTQVYLGTDGEEFLRHEDMATVEEISQVIDEYLREPEKK